MKELIGFCGLDCEKCDARIATLNNDNELRKKTAEKWTSLNNVEIKPEWINCHGCRVEGIKTVFCEQLCEIRKCCIEKKNETCADCTQKKSCSKIEMIKTNSDALTNLGL